MKKICFLIVLIMFMLRVGALTSFPDNFTTNSQGTGLTIDWDDDQTLKTSVNCAASASDLAYPCFHQKNSSAGNVICVSGMGVNPPIANIPYNKASWVNANQAKGVAYIINSVIGDGGSDSITDAQYYWSEILINTYLGVENFKAGQRLYDQYIATKKTISNINTTLDFNSIIENAKEYASRDYTISLSATSGYDNLTFTKKTDGYYYIH